MTNTATLIIRARVGPSSNFVIGRKIPALSLYPQNELSDLEALTLLEESCQVRHRFSWRDFPDLVLVIIWGSGILEPMGPFGHKVSAVAQDMCLSRGGTTSTSVVNSPSPPEQQYVATVSACIILCEYLANDLFLLKERPSPPHLPELASCALHASDHGGATTSPTESPIHFNFLHSQV